MPGFGNFRELYREIEVDWYEHTATHCAGEVDELINLVRAEFQAQIAKGTTPANWLKVQKTLNEFDRDKSVIKAPNPPVDW